MVEKLYYYLKSFFPKVLIKFLNKILKRNINILGNYKNWSEATQNSTGYDCKNIFKKSKESFLKVLNKNAKYEKDSVLFYNENINCEKMLSFMPNFPFHAVLELTGTFIFYLICKFFTLESPRYGTRVV
jgi:hypothetical protein